MHIAMFVEFNSVVSIFVILAVAYLIFFSEKSALSKLRKVSELSFYLAFIISGGWLIYWLSHIEHTKQIGFILAYPSQLLLYASVLRVVSLLGSHFYGKSET